MVLRFTKLRSTFIRVRDFERSVLAVVDVDVVVVVVVVVDDVVVAVVVAVVVLLLLFL